MSTITNVRRDSERDWTWDGDPVPNLQSLSGTYEFVSGEVTAEQLNHMLGVLQAVREAIGLEQQQQLVDDTRAHAEALVAMFDALSPEARSAVRDLLSDWQVTQ